MLPIQQGPPLGCTGLFQRNAKHYIWNQFGCRSCRKDVVVDESTALGAPLLLFPQGLLPKPFSLLGICKVAEDWNQGLPSPRRAAVPGWRVPFTRSSWFRGACDPPPPLLLSVVAVPLGLETKGQSILRPSMSALRPHYDVIFIIRRARGQLCTLSARRQFFETARTVCVQQRMRECWYSASHVGGTAHVLSSSVRTYPQLSILWKLETERNAESDVYPALKSHEQAWSWIWLSEAVWDSCHMEAFYGEWALISTATPGYDNLRTKVTYTVENT